MAKKVASRAGGLRVAADGKIKRAKLDRQIIVRMTLDDALRFANCIVLDAAIHGHDPNMNATLRALVRQWCDRVETVASSQVATDGAKVLKKAVRS